MEEIENQKRLLDVTDSICFEGENIDEVQKSVQIQKQKEKLKIKGNYFGSQDTSFENFGREGESSQLVF